MRLPARLPAAALGITLLVGCGDGTGPDDQVPTTIEIANATLAFSQSLATETLVVTVLDQDGRVISGADPTFSTNEPTVAGVDPSGVVAAFSNGAATITVTAGEATATAEVTVAIASTPVEDGVVVTGLSGPQLTQYYFSIDVPTGDGSPRMLEARLQGGTGDADLYVRAGAQPRPGAVDCGSENDPIDDLENPELCVVLDPDATTWHFVVFGYTTFADIEFEARLVEPTLLESGTTIDGISGGQSRAVYFRADVTEGETLRAETIGGTGDADLFLTNRPIFSLNHFFDIPCVSDNEGNVEECEITALPTGSWTVFLFGYEPFDGVSLTPTIAPGVGANLRRADRSTAGGARSWVGKGPSMR